MTIIKNKLKDFCSSYSPYIDLTFTLVTISFFYALHKGYLKEAIEILKVAKGLIEILIGAV